MGVDGGRDGTMTAMSPEQNRGRALVPAEPIEQAIYLIRGEKVMFDQDLAKLYEVETRALVQAVTRNLDRFPEDFAYRLSWQELTNLKSQTVTSSWGGRRKPPYVFTEQGVAMLSSVLRSRRAVEVNIQIMRTFVRLRELMLTHRDLARKLHELERKYARHEKQFAAVFDAIRQLLEPTREQSKRRIGFR